MARRGEGRIVWVSSREGLKVNPFTGIYSASKHAVEAIAESMKMSSDGRGRRNEGIQNAFDMQPDSCDDQEPLPLPA